MLVKCLSLLWLLQSAFQPAVADGGLQRIITDVQDVPIEAAPWNVYIKLFGVYNGCSGSIYNAHVVITAAHCVFDVFGFLSYDVQVGSAYQNYGGRTIRVLDIIRHEKYDYAIYYKYNIALLRLEEELEFTPKIQPIPLATEEPSLDDEAVITGKSLLETDKYKGLRQLAVKFYNLTLCAKDYKWVPVDDSFLCTFVYKKGACLGEEGNSLVSNGKLAGVLSYSLGCGSSPDVFINVAKLHSWIVKYANVLTP